MNSPKCPFIAIANRRRAVEGGGKSYCQRRAADLRISLGAVSPKRLQYKYSDIGPSSARDSSFLGTSCHDTRCNWDVIIFRRPCPFPIAMSHVTMAAMSGCAPAPAKFQCQRQRDWMWKAVANQES